MFTKKLTPKNCWRCRREFSDRYRGFHQIQLHEYSLWFFVTVGYERIDLLHVSDSIQFLCRRHGVGESNMKQSFHSNKPAFFESTMLTYFEPFRTWHAISISFESTFESLSCQYWSSEKSFFGFILKYCSIRICHLNILNSEYWIRRLHIL